MWYFHNWKHKKSITIDHTKVGGDLTDYPLYIDLSLLGDDFWTSVKNGGGDIRITTSNGTTECPREIVSCDTATKTGEVHALIPSVSSETDTIVYLYYGNASAEDYAVDATYGAQAVRDVFLVKNGNFDYGSGSATATAGSLTWIGDSSYNWGAGRQSNVGATISYDTAVKFLGKQSLKVNVTIIATAGPRGAFGSMAFDVPNSSWAVTNSLANAIPVLPNTEYKLTAKVFLDSADGTKRAAVQYKEFKSDGTTAVSQVSSVVSTAGSWQTITKTFTTNAVTSYVSIMCHAYGTTGETPVAWFDCVFLGVTSLTDTYYNNQNSPATFYGVGEQETFTLNSPFPPFFKS